MCLGSTVDNVNCAFLLQVLIGDRSLTGLPDDVEMEEAERGTRVEQRLDGGNGPFMVSFPSFYLDLYLYVYPSRYHQEPPGTTRDQIWDHPPN